ncbi:Uma2 family endonuclease [Emticicia sp. W12TSBA100-4]|uniref:Uma2 family endonuclease n=1 Tax=Emticicia sp. W12TSBA100-4 TaxID=3160965 RepID=UPI0033056B12
MVKDKEIITLPRTLEEFQTWEPNDGFKYEWNDGELIKFTGMNKLQVKIYDILLDLFIDKGYKKRGTFVAEYDVQLTGIQMRRPDVAYLTKEQIETANKGTDVIPEFVIEIISGNDNINKVEEKIGEYYKAGIKVVWLIFPENKSVHVYTSRRDVKICIENDICSAAPILPEFEIGVDVLLG